MRRTKRRKPWGTAEMVLAGFSDLLTEGSQQRGRRARRAAPQAMQETSGADSDSAATSGSDGSWLPPGAIHVRRQAAQQTNAAMLSAGPSGSLDTDEYCLPAAHEALMGSRGQRQAPRVRHGAPQHAAERPQAPQDAAENPAASLMLTRHAPWRLLWPLKHAWHPSVCLPANYCGT